MKKFQVSFVGISSLYGSTSALLLKQSPFVKCLKLFDPKNVESGLDVATINTQCKVKTFQGHDQIENAFREADIIVISDESGEMFDSDTHLLNVSANLTKYAKAISRASPNAIIVVASPPVNCLLPIMSQLLAKAGCYNYNKIVGSTAVDTMRASALLANHLNMDPKEVVLPVIGGSSEFTRVPVFSQSRPHFSLKKDLKNNLIMDIRRGDSLVLANKGRPEALNRAYSTVRFLNSIMAGLRGDPNVTDITLCRTDLVPGVDYFSLPVMFGREGIIKRFGVPSTTATEDEMVAEAIKHVKKDTDKADYIVKATIKQPENRYLTANERASSQKDMFDLFVKTLPKPEDKDRNSTENDSKKVADFSFKELIKIDKRDPFEAFNNKPPRPASATNLKNVTSADSFLKSAGCVSPMQKPIYILEPLGCPSSPVEKDIDKELDEFFGSEDTLHENNLARFRDKENFEARRTDPFCPSPTKNQPFLSTDFPQQKTVDPIAKFKSQIAKFHEYRNHEKEESLNQLRGKISTEEAVEENDQSKETTELDHPSKEAISNQKDNTKDSKCKELAKPPKKEVHFSSPSGRCMKKKYSTSKRSDNFIFDVKTNRIIPPYNLYKQNKSGKVDYLPVEENGKAYMPRNDVEEYLPNQGKLGNDEKYNKLVSRLFKRLNGLKDGFSLKATSEANMNGPKRKKSSTESPVRFRSPSAHDVPKTHKQHMKLLESWDNGSPQEMAIRKKKHEQREGYLAEESHKETADPKDTPHPQALNENDKVHFVCPKCQIKITCQPQKNEKDIKDSMAKSPKTARPNVQQGEKKVKRNVFVNSFKARDHLYTTQNEVFSHKTSPNDDLQEQRLKKLKEKINRKLIPMMQQNSESLKEESTPPAQTIAQPAKNLETSRFKGEFGSPLVLNHKSSSKKSQTTNETSQREKWLGVPFVVNPKKPEAKDGGNRAVFMKFVAPPANEKLKEQDQPLNQPRKTNYESKINAAIKNQAERKNTADHTDSCEMSQTRPMKMLDKLQSEKIDSAESQSNESNEKTGKRAAKVLNKLQLLELEGKRKMTAKTKKETEEKKDDEKLHERMRSRGDLKADEVQNYMMTRNKGRTLGKASPDKNFNEPPEHTFQKIDFDHLKTEIDEVPPEKSSEQTMSKHNNSQGKSSTTDKSKAKEEKSENKVGAVESKAASEETRIPADKVEMEAGHEKQPEKNTTKESTRAMTSPSKNFENIEELTMPINKEEEINEPMLSNEDQQENPIMLTASDKRNTKKFCDSVKQSFTPSVEALQKIPNKLQLLAMVRSSKPNEANSFKIKIRTKLLNVWEKALHEKPAQKFEPVESHRPHNSVTYGKLDKKSASVKIAKKNNYSVPKKLNLHRPKGVQKNAAILNGFTFPTRRKRKPTNNLLKELTSISKREPKQPKKPKVMGFTRKVNIKPLGRVHLSTNKYQGVKQGASLEPESSEYAQFELAKLASEVLKKKTLQTTLDFKNREWSHKRDAFIPAKTPKVHKTPTNFVCVERPQVTLLEPSTTHARKSARKISFDVADKLMSMPHVRHQVENFELPLGPLEVQPGLSQFNFGKTTGSFSPIPSEGSWEPTINEYSRSSALPSLKDTRETFYLEEHPS